MDGGGAGSRGSFATKETRRVTRPFHRAMARRRRAQTRLRRDPTPPLSCMQQGDPMKRKDIDRINDNAAVYAAMLRAGFTSNRPKLSPADFAKAYGREAVAQQRRYCDAFALWRTCPKRRCGRARRCLGYVADCLKRAFRAVPPRLHVQVQQKLLAGVPRNIARRSARRGRVCLRIFMARERSNKPSLPLPSPQRARASGGEGSRGRFRASPHPGRSFHSRRPSPPRAGGREKKVRSERRHICLLRLHGRG